MSPWLPVSMISPGPLTALAPTRSISAQLRNELPITLCHRPGVRPYSRRHPAYRHQSSRHGAAAVPGHRQARFASLRIAGDPDEVAPGTYVVVLATAATASPRGDEIWGAAVTETKRDAGPGPVNALLAALAKGNLVDAPLPNIKRLPELAERAMDQLHLRHAEEQTRRDNEFEALQEARLLTVTAQHERKLASIRKRMETALSAWPRTRTIDLFRSQERRAKERFAVLVGDPYRWPARDPAGAARRMRCPDHPREQSLWIRSKLDLEDERTTQRRYRRMLQERAQPTYHPSGTARQFPDQATGLPRSSAHAMGRSHRARRPPSARRGLSRRGR